jgi:hypothetical protein
MINRVYTIEQNELHILNKVRPLQGGPLYITAIMDISSK